MDECLQVRRVALIGFGEAGTIIGSDLAQKAVEVSTYDILLDAEPTRAALLERARNAGVRPEDSFADAVRAADLVISAVTASSSHDVARAGAAVLRPGQWFVDINSVSPATKRANAAAVESAGARYVEAAVMAPVPAQRLAVPMLLGGAHAAAMAEALRGLGFNATAVSEEIGTASAIKMCRSIMVKGLEALSVECLFAARRFGAEEAVLASLDRSYPSMGWAAALPDYLVSRVAEHGRRRAAEMREVAATLDDIGLPPLLASAIAERQDLLVRQMSDAGIGYPVGEAFSWRRLADALARETEPATASPRVSRSNA
jgi:3-hydroxyisobutyrate dehydrogenase-like beta-hydroxyacid dehydrogenase